MTTHRNPPFRAEHLGSLLRPKNLLEKLVASEKGQLSNEELTKVEDESVKEIVEVQKEAGFRAITDGEYRYSNVFKGKFKANALLDAPSSGAPFLKSSKA